MNFFTLDQIPQAETSLISIHPMSGAVKAYVGGSNFSKSNFDRVDAFISSIWF